MVELKNMPGTKQEVAAVSVKTATFTSLEAGTQYTVVMVTVSGNQTSDNVETIVFTRMYTYATIYRNVITTLLLMLVVEFMCYYFAYIHMDFQNKNTYSLSLIKCVCVCVCVRACVRASERVRACLRACALVCACVYA